MPTGVLQTKKPNQKQAKKKHQTKNQKNTPKKQKHVVDVHIQMKKYLGWV